MSLADKCIVVGCFVCGDYDKILMETGKFSDNIRVTENGLVSGVDRVLKSSKGVYIIYMFLSLYMFWVALSMYTAIIIVYCTEWQKRDSLFSTGLLHHCTYFLWQFLSYK